MSEWINVEDRLPKQGNLLVTFLIECMGYEKPEDRRFYAEGYFNPRSGWAVENRNIPCYLSPAGFSSKHMRVTHWMPLPEVPK